MERQPTSAGLEEALAHADFLRGLARGLLGDEQLAQDVVQEAYVAALERPPREPAALGAYLARTVRNLALNAGRGQRRRAEREARAARPEAQPPESEAVARLELQRALLEHVLALEEPYRTALYERYYLGLAPRESARRSGLAVKTVKTRLARGLERLRRRLDERSGGDRRTWTAALLPLAFPDGAGVGAATLGALGGGVLMKKLAVVALIAAVAAVAWLRWPLRVLEGEAGRTYLAPELLEPMPAPPPARLVEPAELEGEPARAAAAAEEPAAPTTGALVVELVWADSGLPARDVALDARCAADPAPRDERFFARTDADGRARFPALFAGAVRLELERGPRFEAEVAAGEERALRFEIPAGIELRGQVVDAAGAPVGGAELWVTGQPRQWPSARLVGRAGADGRFELRGLGPRARVGARARGHQPSAEHALEDIPRTPGGARELTLALGPRGGAVEGRVLAPDGTPIEGAVVVVGPPGEHQVELEDGRMAVAAAPAPARTDEDGRFLVAGDLPPGPQPVSATARGYPALEAEALVVEGATVTLELRLEPPGSIAGRVLGVDGEPVAGVDVLAAEELRGDYYTHRLPPCETETDDQGRFRLGWLAPGERELNAHDWRRPELGRARALVPCVAGELVGCELQLELGATITGRVVDGEGRPLAGWSVRAHSEFRGFVPSRQAKSAEDGGFVLANLGQSRFDLEVKAPGRFELTPRAEERGVEPGARGLELVVEDVERAEGRVRGRLVNADGSVPSDAKLTLWPEGVNAGGFVDFDLETGAFDSGPHAAGRYLLRATRGARELAALGPFEIPANGAAELGVVRVEEGAAVELALSGVAEEELGSLRPTLDRLLANTRELELEGGRFVARDVAPGTWTLRVRGSRFSIADVELELRAGETERVELAAEPGREVTLSCVVAGGADWRTLTVELRDAKGRVVRRDGPLSGHAAKPVRLHGLTLAEGTYGVEAWTDAGQRGQAALVVTFDSRAELRLELR